jgi:hypothetical protein
VPRRSTLQYDLAERQLTAAISENHDKPSNPRTKDVAAKARNAHETVGKVDEHGHSQHLQLPPLVRLESSSGSPTAT